MDFIAAYDGPIPGATEKECGNYRDQDLEGARKLASDMAKVLVGWTPERLVYNE